MAGDIDSSLTKDLACFERGDAALEQSEEDRIRREALESGRDLREYASSIEQALESAEETCLSELLSQADELSQFHAQVTECDDVLDVSDPSSALLPVGAIIRVFPKQTMNEMLHTFQESLGSISNEIQSLQQQSAIMSIKLKNRQAVRSELSQYINELVVPETMINHILDTPATERHFVEQLHELNHKISFAKQQAFQDARSAQDVREALEKLKIRATSKIRDYLLQRIQQFKKPLANFQMAQNALLKYRFFYEFLLSNERNIAREVLDEYTDTIAKVYYTYFKVGGRDVTRPFFSGRPEPFFGRRQWPPLSA